MTYQLHITPEGAVSLTVGEAKPDPAIEADAKRFRLIASGEVVVSFRDSPDGPREWLACMAKADPLDAATWHAAPDLGAAIDAAMAQERAGT